MSTPPRRKILLVGLGSIGQRHARNLRALGGDGVTLLAHRARRDAPLLTDPLRPRRDVDPAAALGIETFTDYAAALAQRPDAVYVANPTSLHLATARQAAEAGCHLFIEKPLSHSLEGVPELLDLVARRGLVATVGYQLRFHPALRLARELLAQGAIGRLLGVRADFGEFLPGWHPYEDYRQGYAARAALGGGVVLTQIHDFDYLGWLFGWPERVAAFGGRLGALEIDVEDTVCSQLEVTREGRPFPIQLWQDFLSRPARRRCEVVGEDGTLTVDLVAHAVRCLHRERGVVAEKTFTEFDRNEIFLAQMRNFLASLDGVEMPAVPLAEAARSLAVALAVKESLRRRATVEVPRL